MVSPDMLLMVGAAMTTISAAILAWMFFAYVAETRRLAYKPRRRAK